MHVDQEWEVAERVEFSRIWINAFFAARLFKKEDGFVKVFAKTAIDVRRWQS